MKPRRLLSFKKIKKKGKKRHIEWHYCHGIPDTAERLPFSSYPSFLLQWWQTFLPCRLHSHAQLDTTGPKRCFPETVYSAATTAILIDSKTTNIFIMFRWVIISVYREWSNKPTTAMSHLIYWYWHWNSGHYEFMWFKEVKKTTWTSIIIPLRGMFKKHGHSKTQHWHSVLHL